MIVRAADPEEYPEICEVVDEAFKQSKLERVIVQVTVNEDSNFKRGDLRVAEVNGRIVSMMMLIRRQLRIGTSIVNGAIVAPVATHPDYQKKGYCSSVMRNAIEYMKDQGFDMTILWGNPWLYPHYGYSPAMVKTEIAIKPKHGDLPESGSHEFRPLEQAYLEEITGIYHDNTVNRTCAEIRSAAMWEWTPAGSQDKLQVLLDKSEEVIGYVSLGTDWGRPCAHEIGVLNDEACRAIFNHILGIMKRRDLQEFYCIVHPDHPFARFVFWHDGEIRIRSGGGAGMARVLNLVSLLTKMEVEFDRRLSSSDLHNLDCTLKISTADTYALLDIDHGRVSVSTEDVRSNYQLDIPLSSLNPLITGYRNINELVKDYRVKVRGGKGILRLVQTLFPTGLPYGGFLPVVWE